MAVDYGSIENSSQRKSKPADFKRIFFSVLTAAVAITCLTLYGLSRTSVELIDKEQASWGVIPAEDWDQGWLHKFVESKGKTSKIQATPQKESLLQAQAPKASIQEVDKLMNEALGMLRDLKAHQSERSALSLTNESAIAEPGSSGYVPNKYDLERNAKYAEQQGLVKQLPQCFKINKFDDIAKNEALRRMSEATSQLIKAYPDWTKGISLPGVGQTGEWRHDRGPPYVRRMTMFAGDGVDTIGNGNLVRRVLGLKVAFGKPCDLRSCEHAWTTNEYIRSFEGSQFRFLYRNQCSTLVIPPLTHGAGPILDNNGLYRLHHFLKDGYNTLIVLGSVASVLFLNQNIATLEGGFSLSPDWVSGPYEAQGAQKANTPFAALSVTLPGPGTSVVGVKKATLPLNAISYYEAEDVSVVFEIPMGTGRILYLGYDYTEPVVPWVHALVAATMFSDYDTAAPPPPHLAASLGRT